MMRDIKHTGRKNLEMTILHSFSCSFLRCLTIVIFDILKKLGINYCFFNVLNIKSKDVFKCIPITVKENMRLVILNMKTDDKLTDPTDSGSGTF